MVKVVIADGFHKKGEWVLPVFLENLPKIGDYVFNLNHKVERIIHLPDENTKEIYGQKRNDPIDAVIIYH